MLAARTSRTPYVLTFHSGGHSSAAARGHARDCSGGCWPRCCGRADQLIAVSRFERSHFAAATGIDPRPLHRDPQRRRPAARAERRRCRSRDASSPAVGSSATRVTTARSRPCRWSASGSRPPTCSSSAAAATSRSCARWPRDLGRRGRRRDPAPAADRPRRRWPTSWARASVMAALSTYEAHPVGIMEAVTLGLPVVGLDVAGTGDLVEDGLVTGIPVDASTDDLADALTRALEETAARGHRPPARGARPADLGDDGRRCRRGLPRRPRPPTAEPEGDAVMPHRPTARSSTSSPP